MKSRWYRIETNALPERGAWTYPRWTPGALCVSRRWMSSGGGPRDAPRGGAGLATSSCPWRPNARQARWTMALQVVWQVLKALRAHGDPATDAAINVDGLNGQGAEEAIIVEQVSLEGEEAGRSAGWLCAR